MTAIGNTDKVCHHPFWILKNQYSLNIQVIKIKIHPWSQCLNRPNEFFCLFSSRLCPHNRSDRIIFKMFMWKPSLSCLGKPYEKLSICQSPVSHWGGKKEWDLSMFSKHLQIRRVAEMTPRQNSIVSGTRSSGFKPWLGISGKVTQQFYILLAFLSVNENDKNNIS